MALPSDVTTFELTFGPYTDAAGEPVFAGMTGKIKPSFPQIRHIESGAVVIDAPIPVQIDGFGVASVQLAHTDQAVLSPVGFTYSVVWDVASRKPSPGNKQFAVPTSAGAEVDFDLLAPSPDVEGVVVPLTYGKSAYDLAVENGFVGTEAAWLASLIDPEGLADPVVSTLVANTASATSVALRAAYGAPTPSYAGTSPNRFDASSSVYNLKASNTRRLRAKMAAALAGVGLCRLTAMGDSLTAGYGAAPGTSDYVRQLRGILANRGYPVGELVFPYNNIGGGDSRFALTGWNTGSLTAPWISKNGAGATATYTSSVVGSVVEWLTFGTSAAVTFSVDGGAGGSPARSGANAAQLLTVTSSLANATHTVVGTSGSGTGMIAALGVRSQAGVVLCNAGLGGSTVANWLATGGSSWFGPLATALATAPDAVLLELVMNEALQAIAPATFQANLAAAVTQIRATGADVLLSASHSPSTDGNPGAYAAVSTASFSALLAAIYNVADSADVALLDFTDRFGPYTAAAAQGVTSDGVHLNATGYGAKAQAWARVLTA